MSKKANKKIAFTLFVLSIILMISISGTYKAVADEKKGAKEQSVKSVIVEEVVPHGKFKVSIRTNKTSYKVGEYMQVTVRSEEKGYLTIYDIQPNGVVNRIFPNYYHPGQKIEAGKEYRIPLPTSPFRFHIGPPRGREVLWAIVSSKPGVFSLKEATEGSPFPQVTKDPSKFAKSIKGITVEQKNRWGAGYSIFYIGRPLGGHLKVSSQPTGASIFLNGSFRGKTPMTIYDLKPGQYNLKLSKKGFQDWSRSLQVGLGKTKQVKATMIPPPPKIENAKGKPSPSVEGQMVTFQASASDPGEDPLNYNWRIAGASYQGSSVKVPFREQGKYRWTLKVTDGDGGVAETAGTHTVKNVPPKINNAGPTPSPSVEGQMVNFQASATDPGEDPLSYSWTIAGSRYQGPSVKVPFRDQGKYRWTLKVTDGDGGVAETAGTQLIKVKEPTQTTVYISFPEEGKIRKVLYSILSLKTLSLQVDTPRGLVCSEDGGLYIADSGTKLIKRYSTTSGRVRIVGNLKRSPINLAFGPRKNLYVVDKGGSIYKLNKGALGTSANKGSSGKGTVSSPRIVFSSDLKPRDIDFLTRGKFAGDMIVSLYSPSTGQGKVIRLVGPRYDRAKPFISTYPGYREKGVKPTKKLNDPRGLAVSRKGDVYVGEFYQSEGRILRYSPQGKFLELFKKTSRPEDLGIDWHQRLYATTSSMSDGKKTTSSLRRFYPGGKEAGSITRLGAWGIAICEK